MFKGKSAALERVVLFAIALLPVTSSLVMVLILLLKSDLAIANSSFANCKEQLLANLTSRFT